MEYKGYTASVEFDPEDMTFYGRVQGIVDRVSFSGDSPQELVDTFHSAIDAYIESCRETGGEPEVPLSGRMLLRIGSKLHTHMARSAKRGGVSNNAWVVEAVREKLAREEDSARRIACVGTGISSEKTLKQAQVIQMQFSVSQGAGQSPGTADVAWSSERAGYVAPRTQ